MIDFRKLPVLGAARRAENVLIKRLRPRLNKNTEPRKIAIFARVRPETKAALLTIATQNNWTFTKAFTSAILESPRMKSELRRAALKEREETPND